MNAVFPFEEDLAQQRVDFLLIPATPAIIPKAEALEAAGQQWVREEWPQAMCDAWLGYFTQRGGDWAPLPDLDRRLSWLVRFAPIRERRIGRGGGSRTSTERWVVIDAMTGKTLQAFSFR